MIQPRAQRDATASTAKTDKPSRRELIANEAASPTSFASLAATPKLPAPPSTSLVPVSARGLIKKLRWANIGWYYHWGTKQYDFTRPKVLVDGQVSQYCKRAVKGVDWAKVFDGSEGVWPEDDKGWQDWVETYGKQPTQYTNR
jgi:alkylated DNA repair protein alkB family protein 1